MKDNRSVSKSSVSPTGILVPGISLPKNMSQADAKQVVKHLAKVNDQIVTIMEADNDAYEQLKTVKTEIQRLTKKQRDIIKNIKTETKQRNEAKLMLLGERESLRKILETMGAVIDKKQFNQLAPASAADVFEIKEN